MQLASAIETQLGAPPESAGAPLDSWQAIAQVFASEPGAIDARGRPVRGYVNKRIVETSGPPRPLLDRLRGARNPQYGIGMREAQRYTRVKGGQQKRGATVGPGDPIFERVRASAEESQRQQQSAEAQARLGAEGYRDITETGLDVTITGTFLCSKDKRYGRTLSVYIDGEDLQEFLALWAAGEEDAAADAFQEAFFDSVPIGAAAQWLDVEEITIT